MTAPGPQVETNNFFVYFKKMIYPEGEGFIGQAFTPVVFIVDGHTDRLPMGLFTLPVPGYSAD